MWVERTPEEVEKWHEAARREARSHGRLIAGIAWVAISILMAGGWFVSFRGGFAAQQGQSGSFWIRLPVIALIALPFAWFIFRRESKNELESISRRTICPKCDTAAEGNAGASCPCGSSFTSQSTVKWVEE